MLPPDGREILAGKVRNFHISLHDALWPVGQETGKLTNSKLLLPRFPTITVFVGMI